MVLFGLDVGGRLSLLQGCQIGGLEDRVEAQGGRVFQPQGVLLRKSDRDFGYIHSCMAWPISDLEIMV